MLKLQAEISITRLKNYTLKEEFKYKNFAQNEALIKNSNALTIVALSIDLNTIIYANRVMTNLSLSHLQNRLYLLYCLILQTHIVYPRWQFATIKSNSKRPG